MNTQHKPYSIDQLVDLYFNQLLPMKEIASTVGISQDYVRQLLRRAGYKKRDRMSLPHRHASRPKMDVSPTPEQEQIIFGTLLGDATLKRPRMFGGKHMNSALGVRHSAKQEEFVRWKNEMLKPFSFPVHFMDRTEKRERWKDAVTNQTIYFNCVSHSYFTNLYPLWYPEGTKVFDPSNIKNLDFLGLAVWFMDDGTYGHSKSSPYGFLCTEGFGLESQEAIKNFLHFQFDLACSVVSTGLGSKKIRLSASGMKLLQEKLKPIIQENVPSMLYKLGC